MASEILVYIDVGGAPRHVGSLKRNLARGRETVTFLYTREWQANANSFALEPNLRVGEGAFVPGAKQTLFGSIGDSAPDTWGRRLMLRAERLRARDEGRAVRTLTEVDFLLGVTDIARLGALRFRRPLDTDFQSPTHIGVPHLVDLPKLLGVADRFSRDEDTLEDLKLILAPGSSLGGARPKASVVDRNGALAIAKFPKEDDAYSVERWEAVALQLARLAGISTAADHLVKVAKRQVLVSRRFDRNGAVRIPFLSALAMLGAVDGERGSYPDIADAISEHGAAAKDDAHELYRRMAFNVLVSNVDDHLRNHGFLWGGKNGWRLSPMYDVNPVPVDVRPRILTTAIAGDDGTCDLDLVLSVAGLFGLSAKAAKTIVGEVGRATAEWTAVAKKLGAPKSETERLASAFEHREADAARKI